MTTSKVHYFVCDDIWYEISKYIAPEDVGRYSLICTQSAKSIDNYKFWLEIYKRFCLNTANVKSLPHYLSIEHLSDCDKNDLRHRVIRALFHCHPSLIGRLKTRTPLKALIGKTLVSQWYKDTPELCSRFLIFKIGSPLPKETNSKETSGQSYECHIWECAHAQNFEGLTGLFIRSDRFIPFPDETLDLHNGNTYTLTAYRLSNSEASVLYEIELDLLSSESNDITTLKFSIIQKYNVIPWWDPKFSDCWHLHNPSLIAGFPLC